MMDGPGVIVLGFDGGGTKCEAVVVDATGAVLSRGRGGPTVDWYEGAERVRASVSQAVDEAICGRPASFAAAVGCSPGTGAALRSLRELVSAPLFREAREYDLIRATHLEDHGLVVLAGTGSFVHAQSRSGREVYLGGGGPLIGDEGSAYHIGLAGIRAAYRSDYSPTRATSLRPRILAALGLSHVAGIIDFLYGERPGAGDRRTGIAALARVVDEEAGAGDSVAVSIMSDAARQLGDLAVEAVYGAAMERHTFPLMPAGGVAAHSALFREALVAHVRNSVPGAHLLAPLLPPVVGAAFLALRDAGVEWGPHLVANALRSEAFGLESSFD